MSKTIIVSNRLPVRIEREDDQLTYQSSEGGLATGLGSIYKQGNNIWIGWPGASFDPEELKNEVTEGLRKESMLPVFLTDEDVEKFYLGFSNQTLWPACHYFTHFVDYEEKNWQSYVDVNQKFANKIREHIDPGDIVWVHDYQLFLVPGMLRKIMPDLTIGFFLHIPFPSYEIFRTLPWRRELLRGMLGADYVAFHTYDDMRHFMSSVHRLAGFSYKGNQVQLNERTVVVDSLPMGIDYKKYAENAIHPEAIERAERYRKSLGDQKLILSVDRLDYSKGIPKRLRAFDRFLELHPTYRRKVSLMLIVVPSRDQVPDYQLLKEQVDELVGKINSKYGRMSWTPIHYFYRSYPFRALGAFYRMCDIAMVTPVRDGMNLVCKEYVASRHNQDGVLILSEMAGASKELSDAILVNPNDQGEMVAAIVRALEMPVEEQRIHMKLMQATVQKYDIFNWVKLFFDNLGNARTMRKDMSTLSLEGTKRDSMLRAYRSAKRRLIILDYDGTLVGFKDDPEACAPDDELRELLSRLANTPENELVVISGRKKESLGAWLDFLPITLAAEHGIWQRPAGGEWKQNPRAGNASWKNEARDIMEFYVDRTPGSFIEEKTHALAWHYRKVEKGLGEVRKSELTSHLNHMMRDRHCQVMDGDHVVELKPDAVNKGLIAADIHAASASDFTLCVGDDVTDEYMFEALPADAFTVKVGRGKSHARYFLDSVTEVRRLLGDL